MRFLRKRVSRLVSGGTVDFTRADGFHLPEFSWVARHPRG
jgi:hypothetical protein